jgi:GrpB-like predicted nucleotidyltransferase (UPF0157 family)
MFTVDDRDDDAFTVPPTSAGYVLQVIEPEHRLFRTPARDVHAHVSPAGSDDERRLVLFCDWLRTNEDDRHRYESVRRKLAFLQAVYLSESDS